MKRYRNLTVLQCGDWILIISAVLGSLCEGRSQIYFDLADTENIKEIDMSNLTEFSLNMQILVSSPLPEKVDRTLRIIAPKGYKLMGFVKSSQLRANLHSTSCKDFISFERPEGPPDIVCREVHSYDRSRHPPKLIGPRVLRSPNEQMTIKIHSDYYFTLPRNQSKVLAELVFTAITECWRLLKSSSGFLRCSREDSFSCIPSSLVCDGDINCLFESGFAQDEEKCRGIASGSESQKKRADLMNETQKTRVQSQDSEYRQIREYFIPTGFILFFIWGVITLLRKCYKCYKTEYGKDELYY